MATGPQPALGTRPSVGGAPAGGHPGRRDYRSLLTVRIKNRIPERIWVGAGVLLFGVFLADKGLGDGSYLVTLTGVALAAGGVLALAGIIRPPDRPNGPDRS